MRRFQAVEFLGQLVGAIARRTDHRIVEEVVQRGLVIERHQPQERAVLAGLGGGERNGGAGEIAHALRGMAGLVRIVGDIDIALHRQRHVGGIAPAGLPSLGDHAAKRLRRLQAAMAEAHERRVAARRHARENLGMAARHEDFRHRQPERAHRELGARDAVELAGILHHAAGQALFQNVPGLQHLLVAVVRVDAETVEFIRLIAAAQAQYEPASRQQVGEGGLLHQPQRLVERQGQYGRPEADMGGLRRAMGHHHEGGRADRMVGEVMLREPGDVEAEILRHLHRVDRGAQHRGGRGVPVIQAHEVEEAESCHCGPPIATELAPGNAHLRACPMVRRRPVTARMPVIADMELFVSKHRKRPAPPQISSSYAWPSAAFPLSPAAAFLIVA